jgi:hypothetical protein
MGLVEPIYGVFVALKLSVNNFVSVGNSVVFSFQSSETGQYLIVNAFNENNLLKGVITRLLLLNVHGSLIFTVLLGQVLQKILVETHSVVDDVLRLLRVGSVFVKQSKAGESVEAFGAEIA